MGNRGRHQGPLERRCRQRGGRTFGVGCRENKLEGSGVVVTRCTGLHWAELAGV